MYLVKIFKVAPLQIIVCMSENCYTEELFRQYRTVQMVYDDAVVETNSKYLYVPRSRISNITIMGGIEKYIEQVKDTFSDIIGKGEMQIQYSDITTEIVDKKVICFVRRDTGILCYYKTSYDNRKYVLCGIDDNFTKKRLDEKTLIAFNV